MNVPVAPPRVTVLLPVRDAVETLPRAVASIVGQSSTDWELLAVDDGSRDGSAEWLAAAGATDARIRLLRRPAEGIVAALNAGLAAARGTFIARLDADDESLPGRLEAQAGFLEANAGIGLVASRVEYGGDRVVGAGYAAHVDWLNSVGTAAEIETARFIEAPFAHPSVMFRRELVELHGGYRAGDFPEDYELWLRWLEAGVGMAKLPDVLLRWYDPPGRLSRTDPRYAPEAFFRLKAGFLARWLRRQILPGRSLLIWGAGRLTRRRVEALEGEGIRIDGFIDIDPRKQRTRPGGRPVFAPEAIPDPKSAFVVGYVANRGARELQRDYLRGRGYAEGRDFLFAA